MASHDEPTERFTSRAENYVRFRPSYPRTIIDLLERVIGLRRDWSVADIGSGPGNLSRLFLDLVCVVYGVEPNQAMREAGERQLVQYERFRSIDGTAESTSLPEASVDLVTAGQAFHWFESELSRTEFRRVLREPRWVVLVWNKTPSISSAPIEAYWTLIDRYSNEAEAIERRDARASRGMDVLYGSGTYEQFILPNDQELSYEAFWGRMLSSSYTPLPGEDGHVEIEQASREYFDQFADEGILRFPYETHVFVGRV